MKAIQITKTGGPDVLALVDLPTPAPGPGEVVIRAHAIGVGKPDVLFRTGVYRWMPPLPAIPGAEMAGHIEALGDDVSVLKRGEPVLVYHLGGGCYAQYAKVPASAVTRLPATIDLDDAVSIPNYQVACALLTEAARGIAVKTAYVNGAAGGIGSAVIQLCRLQGITIVAGAGSVTKCNFAQSQGATHTIDYSRENVAERLLALTQGHGVDLILDHIVGKDFTDNLKALAPFGLIVSFNALGGLPEKDLFREMRAHLPKSPGVRCFTMHSFDHDPAGRQRVAARTLALFSEGRVRPPIDRRLPLAEARQAHTLLDQRAVLGKLILKP
ncbi:MAG TPA: zinc-dependent alcohol dehydrogenase family protein [Stellaceae bacterium]|jgi:NADPH2:quinone reductase|nr:zinc-dependent alcohol dehydrogenase family protein [Stellaceae bacterium]